MRAFVNAFDLKRYAGRAGGYRAQRHMRKKETRDIVLVVDDSPDTLSMLTDALEEAGMTVLVAREGDHALSIVETVTARRHPDGRGDAGHGRLRDLPPSQAEQGAGACAGHLHDRAERHRAHHRGPGGRRRRLCHQADRARTNCWRASACISPMRAWRTARARRWTRSAASSWPANRGGRVLWCTPQAAKLLGTAFRDFDTDELCRCRRNVQDWLHQCAAAPACLAAAGDRSRSPMRHRSKLQLLYVGQIGADEHLLRCWKADAATTRPCSSRSSW